MKIAIAQINCTVGDLLGNTAKILAVTEQAKLAGADLVITPELALCGYPHRTYCCVRSFIWRATKH